MTLSSSAADVASSLDWADDIEDEIDFGAPVFSDDEDLPVELTTGVHSSSSSTLADSAPSPSTRYTAGFADGSNTSLERKSHNESSLQTMSTRARPQHHSRPFRDSPPPHRPHASDLSPASRGSSFAHDRDGHRYEEREQRWTDNKPSKPATGSSRQIIPLPPKPTSAALEPCRNQRGHDRSRSPSYRSHSPLPGTNHDRERSTRDPSLPHNRAHSPNGRLGHSSSPQRDMGGRSFSPARQTRTHMDQVIQAKENSNRRSRDLTSASASEGRWEKTLHEDKPYPALHTSHDRSSFKDDTVYFKRREGKTTDLTHSSSLQRERNSPAPTTMYHERLETSGHGRHPGLISNSAREAASGGGRWEKAKELEPDLPYPDRPVSNYSPSKHSRTRSRGQTENAPSPPKEKPQQRGQRGKGKDHSKQQKSDAVAVEDHSWEKEDTTTRVPWWEQSTYGAKPRTEPVKGSVQSLPPTKVSPKEAELLPTNAPTLTSTSSKSATSAIPAKDPKTLAHSKEPRKEVPWWEQSTYGTKAKSSPSTSTTEPSSSLASSVTNTDTLERRKGLGQKNVVQGVEALTLVSRSGGQESGSGPSLKSRHVQELVFAEIKEMVALYENRYGSDKTRPIPARSLQAEQMDKIIESFRKLREGLFATEARDDFAVQVYEQSVLCSLYGGNIPELTKALHHLVQELHPAVYPIHPAQISLSGSPTLLSEQRQRFLALFILHHLAKPPTLLTLQSRENFTPANSQPRTETDQLVVSLVHLFDLHRSSGLNASPNSVLGPDLLFALHYWKTLRDNNWVQREKLLSQETALPWEQRLMIQHSLGHALNSARSLTVAVMSKAFYSLPISAMTQAVGSSLADQNPMEQFVENSPRDQETVKHLQTSFGLRSNIVVKSGQLMLKAKS